MSATSSIYNRWQCAASATVYSLPYEVLRFWYTVRFTQRYHEKVKMHHMCLSRTPQCLCPVQSEKGTCFTAWFVARESTRPVRVNPAHLEHVWGSARYANTRRRSRLSTSMCPCRIWI